MCACLWHNIFDIFGDKKSAKTMQNEHEIFSRLQSRTLEKQENILFPSPIIEIQKPHTPFGHCFPKRLIPTEFLSVSSRRLLQTLTMTVCPTGATPQPKYASFASTQMRVWGRAGRGTAFCRNCWAMRTLCFKLIATPDSESIGMPDSSPCRKTARLTGHC